MGYGVEICLAVTGGSRYFEAYGNFKNVKQHNVSEVIQLASLLEQHPTLKGLQIYKKVILTQVIN